MSTESSPDRAGVCAWCEHENAPGSRFCGNCGRTLLFDVACPFCGRKNPEENAHCDACGVLLDESKRTASTGTSYSDRLRDRMGSLGWPLVTLAAIIAFALLIRLFSLTDIPPNLVPDEADNLITVYRIMADIGPGFFELDWKPQPAFSAYMMGWFMGVFGETIVGMRMASVALSTASILVFYAVVRQQDVGRPASLGATFLLATGVWYLHFSRSGWENVHVALYALSAMLALNAAIRSKRMSTSLLLFAATGLFAALGLYGYTGGRVIIVALLVYLPIAFFLHREDWKRLLFGYSVMCLTAFVLFWPQFDNAREDWGELQPACRYGLCAQRAKSPEVRRQGRLRDRRSADVGKRQGICPYRYRPVARGVEREIHSAGARPTRQVDDDLVLGRACRFRHQMAADPPVVGLLCRDDISHPGAGQRYARRRASRRGRPYILSLRRPRPWTGCSV